MTTHATPASQGANTDLPIRVGIFSTIADADRAVSGLLAAGYHRDQITVISSDARKEAPFHEFEHQDEAGAHTAAAVTAGGVIGAALGGFVVLAGVAATGGIALLAAGGVAAWTGGIVGGLIGAMMTRGVERELADYYDQAVVQGRILVAAEVTEDHPGPPLAIARQVLEDAGAEPVALRES